MFQTSLDLMYGVISLSIIVFTFFLVWIMYYVAQILRQGYEVVQEIREKIAEFEEALDTIKDKVLSSAASISFVANEIGTVVDVVQSLKPKKRATRKRKTTTASKKKTAKK